MVDFWNGIQSRHNMIRYTSDLAFQVHLLSVITNVRGVPLNMFEKIMDVIFVHCIQRILISTIPSSAPLGKDLSTG
jgi:hypothetical protein